MFLTDIGYILGLLWGIIGIMEKKMETTIVFWGNIGVQILSLSRDYRGIIQG